MSRLIANLIDNALRCGAPPVDIATRADGRSAVLGVADRGPGIAADQVERLKTFHARRAWRARAVPGGARARDRAHRTPSRGDVRAAVARGWRHLRARPSPAAAHHRFLIGGIAAAITAIVPGTTSSEVNAARMAPGIGVGRRVERSTQT
jgi:hypothetical protein